MMMVSQWRVGDVVDGVYRVTFVHEHGGVGLVYRVRHLRWGTDLAVKSPRPEEFWSDEDREQFVAGAETWLLLGVHPHVCCCHFVRMVDGVPRVFAEYVPGGSLREWIEDRRLYAGEALARILDLAIQVAWGLGHAHERGLVHQDVKPGNVLVDTDGTAKVTDFGLARAKGVAVSPEQAAGEPTDRRCDIYGFGVSVLEMFTGRMIRTSGPAAGAALRALRDGGAPGPGLPAMPFRLAELLERCLAAGPAQRPGSMTEVAEELIAIYTLEIGRPFPRTAPVPADLRADELNNRALSLLDLGRREAAGEAFAAALRADPQHLGATYNAALSRWRRGEITDEIVVSELEAVRAGTGDPWPARHLLGLIHLERGDVARAEPLLTDAMRESGNEPEVCAAGEVLSRLTDARRIGTHQMRWEDRPREWLGTRFVPPLPVVIGLSGDGTRVVTGDWYGVITLWDARNGDKLGWLFNHSGRVQAVDLSADGRTAISVSTDNTVRVWDLAGQRCVHRFDVEHPDADDEMDYPICVRADGRVGLWAGSDSRAQVVDLVSGERLCTLDEHDGRVRAIAVSADGRLALTSSGQVWELASGRCVRRLIGSAGATLATLCVSADGRFGLTAGSSSSEIQLWDLETGECVWEQLSGHTGVVHALALSADGRVALSGSGDRTVRLWDLANGRCLRTLRGHTDAVNAVLLSQDATWALSAGQDNTLRRWSLPRGGYLAPPRLARPRTHAELTTLHARAENLIADAERALSDGRYPDALELLTRARSIPGHERTPRVLTAWQVLGRHATRVGLRAAWQIGTLADQSPLTTITADLSADGRTAMTADSGGTVTLWDVESAASTGTFAVTAYLELATACLSPDGKHVVTAANDGTIALWHAGSGEALHELEATTRSVNTMRFSPDGSRVVSGGFIGQIRVWDVASGRCTQTMEQPEGLVGSIWISGDGRLAVTASDRPDVWLWDLDCGECVLTMRGHTDEGVTSVCLSPDGRIVLSSDKSDRTIRLWDAATGACLQVLNDVPSLLNDVPSLSERGAAAQVAHALCVRFSPDGRFVLASHADAAIRVWDVRSGRCVRTIVGHTKAVAAVEVPADARLLLSGVVPSVAEGDSVRLWQLDWDLSLSASPAR